jgi:N6-adenosine-specific RNA methylase IME4
MSDLAVREKALHNTSWPFGALVPFSYDVVMVDPPWPTVLRSPKGEAKSSLAKYGAMSFPAIEALPVGSLLKRDAAVWLWATFPLLLDGGDPRQHFAGADASRSNVGACLKAWGLRYSTGGPWLKRRSKGGIAFGTGYRLRSATEPFLIGITGSPKTTRSERNFIEGLAREHSRKPEEAYALIERWMPGGRFVELFSRTSRPGWDTWGLEAGKFDPAVALNAAPVRLEVTA